MIPDKIGIFGLSLGSIMTVYLAAESTIVKASRGSFIFIPEYVGVNQRSGVRLYHCVVFQPLCCVCVSASHFYPPGKNLHGVYEVMTMWVICCVISISALQTVSQFGVM